MTTFIPVSNGVPKGTAGWLSYVNDFVEYSKVSRRRAALVGQKRAWAEQR